MITLIDRLKELIHPDAIQTPRYDNARKKAIYTLSEEKSPTSRIMLAGVPEDSIIFNLDDFFPCPQKYIFTVDSKQVCCRADYVIVASDSQKTNKYHFIFIEMKTDKDLEGMRHICNQLRGARCFLDYCISLIRHFWNCKVEEINEDDCRYVACLKTGKDVSNRYDNNEPPHKDVDDPLKLEGRRLYQYNQLIGRKPR